MIAIQKKNKKTKLTAKLKHKKYKTLSMKMTLISKTVYTYYYGYFYIVQQIYLVSPDAHLQIQFRKTFDNQQLLTNELEVRESFIEIHKELCFFCEALWCRG